MDYSAHKNDKEKFIHEATQILINAEKSYASNDDVLFLVQKTVVEKLLCAGLSLKRIVDITGLHPETIIELKSDIFHTN